MSNPDDTRPSPASIAAAQMAALAELREVADVMATANGHHLGLWHDGHDEGEVSYCQHCHRAVEIDVLRDPHIAGQAISMLCPTITPPVPLTAEQLERQAAQAVLAEMLDRYGAARVARWVSHLAAIKGMAL